MNTLVESQSIQGTGDPSTIVHLNKARCLLLTHGSPLSFGSRKKVWTSVHYIMCSSCSLILIKNNNNKSILENRRKQKHLSTGNRQPNCLYLSFWSNWLHSVMAREKWHHPHIDVLSWCVPCQPCLCFLFFVHCCFFPTCFPLLFPHLLLPPVCACVCKGSIPWHGQNKKRHFYLDAIPSILQRKKDPSDGGSKVG